jgi:hypothetical protein
MYDLEGLKEILVRAYRSMISYDSKDVVLIFHDDADGISSGAIAYKVLSELGYNVRLVCIEKLLDDIIQFVHMNYSGSIIIYVDIGSPHADKISMYNNGRNLVIILDHHDPKSVDDPSIFNLNPELYGFQGEIDASGSIITYLFWKTIDKKNIMFSKIALIGAQELPTQEGYLVKIVYSDANKVEMDINYKEMFKYLQILGPVGYYENGPKMGIKACIEGMNEEIKNKIRELEIRRKTANKKLLAILYKRGLYQGNYIQWFDSYGVFRGMGTKVIGSFCSYLSYQKRLVHQEKYLFGYMYMPNYIPDLMELKGEWIKISGRAPGNVKRYITSGIYPSIADIMIKAADEIGGAADGHKFAASAVIPKESIREYIEKLDRLITEKIQ